MNDRRNSGAAKGLITILTAVSCAVGSWRACNTTLKGGRQFGKSVDFVEYLKYFGKREPPADEAANFFKAMRRGGSEANLDRIERSDDGISEISHAEPDNLGVLKSEEKINDLKKTPFYDDVVTLERQDFDGLDPERLRCNVMELKRDVDSSGIRAQFNLLIPDEQHFKSVFGYSPTRRDLLRLKASKGKFSSAFSREKVFTDSDQFIEEAFKGDSNLVVIVGHSSVIGKKKNLVLPNGKTLDIHQLHIAANRQHKICLMVTCHSDDLNLKSSVALHDAISALVSISNEIEKNRTITVDEVISLIRKELINKKIKKYMLTTTVGVGSTGSGVVYLIRD